MDAVMIIVALVVGLAIGAGVAAWLLGRANRLAVDAATLAARADAETRLATATAQLAASGADVRDLLARLEASVAEGRASATALSDARVVAAGLEAALREERERAGREALARGQVRDELSAHFKALAGDALEANRSRIAEQQHVSLDLILKPLGDKLTSFEKKVEEAYDKEAQQRSSLRQEVINLKDATARINEDANNLARALKGEAKTRGDWGEVVLERVLERSGLVKGREYVIQPSLRGDDGALLRPDVIVNLPDDKHVVIDSKVSLVAYDRYYAATDDATRAQHARAHVDGMRRHVRALGGKSYPLLEGIDAPDFVVMFVPIEPAYGLAASVDAELFLDAWGHKVVIVTPSTLLALLMTVQSLWQRDKQTRNAIEIAEQAGALHDQFVLVLESLQVLGKQLRDAQNAFELTDRRLSEGRGSLVKRIAQLQALGAKTKRQLPPKFAARATDDADHDPPAAERTASAPTSASKLSLVPPAAGDADPP